MADVTIGIDISVAEAAKNIKKLPELASEAAEEAAKNMMVAFDRFTAELKTQNAIARQNALAIKGIGDAAGRAGANASKLAGILGMISPELAEIARSGADAGDAVEVSSGAMQAMGLSAVKMGNILGIAAVAAAALGATYVSLKGDLARATAEMDTQAGAAMRVSASYAQLEGAQIDLRVASGEITEAQGRQLKSALALV